MVFACKLFEKKKSNERQFLTKTLKKLPLITGDPIAELHKN